MRSCWIRSITSPVCRQLSSSITATNQPIQTMSGNVTHRNILGSPGEVRRLHFAAKENSGSYGTAFVQAFVGGISLIRARKPGLRCAAYYYRRPLYARYLVSALAGCTSREGGFFDSRARAMNELTSPLDACAIAPTKNMPKSPDPRAHLQGRVGARSLRSRTDRPLRLLKVYPISRAAGPLIWGRKGSRGKIQSSRASPRSRPT